MGAKIQIQQTIKHTFYCEISRWFVGNLSEVENISKIAPTAYYLTHQGAEETEPGHFWVEIRPRTSSEKEFLDFGDEFNFRLTLRDFRCGTSKNNTQYFYLYSIKKFLKGTILGFNRILDWGSKKSSEFNPWDDEMKTSEGLTAILPHSIPHYTATYIYNQQTLHFTCMHNVSRSTTNESRQGFLFRLVVDHKILWIFNPFPLRFHLIVFTMCTTHLCF